MHGESPSERVVRGVASAAGRDPLELPPLFGSVDPEALDATVRTISDGTVSFRFAGYEVAVDSGGEVELTELPTGGTAADSAASGD